MKNRRLLHMFSLLLGLAVIAGCLQLPANPEPQDSPEVAAPVQEIETPGPNPVEPDSAVPLPEQKPAGQKEGQDESPAGQSPPSQEKNINQVPVQAEEGISTFPSICSEHISLLNAERQRSGLKALDVNRQLSDTAEWVAREYLRTGADVSAEAIKKRLAPYPELAAASFSMHRASASGTKGDRFSRWFAEERHDDVTGSQSLREDLLDRDTALAGVACVGGLGTIDGERKYTMVFVWLFMPQPPPAGISNHSSAAVDNIAHLNTERTGRGLGTLQTHAGLSDLAYLKAKDILENLPYDGLAHESEKLGSPHEMIMAHIQPAPLSTAENLWTLYGSYHSNFMDGVPQKAHDGLMNSEGHRKNILHADFTHIGVGVTAGLVEGKYKVVLVQLFITEGK